MSLSYEEQLKFNELLKKNRYYLLGEKVENPESPLVAQKQKQEIENFKKFKTKFVKGDIIEEKGKTLILMNFQE